MDPHTTDPLADSAPEGPGTEPHTRRVSESETFAFDSDCQLVTDGKGLILAVNSAAAVLFGQRQEFLIGKPLGLFAPAGARRPFYEYLGRPGQETTRGAFQTRISRRGGEPREVRVLVRAGTSLGVAAGALHWLIRDVTAQVRAEAERANLRQRLIAAQEDERRRVARDLHDTAGQTLAALTLSVAAARTAPLPASVVSQLDAVQNLADELARQLHDLAVRLRPTVLDDIGLSAALAQLVADWSARTRVPANFHAPARDDERFPAEVETALYRVTQEALTNVTRHAAARNVGVLVGAHAGHAIAVVEDDGAGFDPDAILKAGRLGILGMRERMVLIGGTLEIESAPGKGTTVIARVPLETPLGE